jgi:hypothetical protein
MSFSSSLQAKRIMNRVVKKREAALDLIRQRSVVYSSTKKNALSRCGKLLTSKSLEHERDISPDDDYLAESEARDYDMTRVGFCVRKTRALITIVDGDVTLVEYKIRIPTNTTPVKKRDGRKAYLLE